MIPLDGVKVPVFDQGYIGDISPYDHQVTADELFSSAEEFFAVNSSPTGSGKTYSWLKPAVERGLNTIAIFPTNALTADQKEAAESFVESYFPDSSVNVLRITSHVVRKWQNESRFDRDKGKAIRYHIQKSLDTNRTTILLTNPDTFVLVRKHLYSHRYLDLQFNRFELIVLDEFHLADVKQRDSLLFLIDEVYNLPDTVSRTKRFYFLTATPERDDSERRGLLSRIEDTIGQTPHHISASAVPSTATENGREVMPSVDLRLDEAKTFKCADALLAEETFDEFVSFCASGTTVVMVDGVDEVDRIYEALDNELNETVERITGFHSGDVGPKISTFDVLVSNAAVEVGLDVQPGQVVFSARNPASLVQRLGRLRKRDDIEGPYQAWCFVPPSVRPRLHANIDAEIRTGDGGTRVSREAFESSVREAFSKQCDVSSFSRRWSDKIALYHVKNRVNNAPDEQMERKIFEEGLDRIRRHFYDPYDRPFSEQGIATLVDDAGWRLLDRIQTYRGDTLQVMIHDKQTDEMKLYDLFFVLRWGDVTFLPPDDYRESLPDQHREFFDSYRRYALGFCKYRGKVDRIEGPSGFPGRSVTLHDQAGALHKMANLPDNLREPKVVDGLGVNVDHDGCPPVGGIDHLRDYMIGEERVCYAFPGSPSKNKTRFGLDDFFFVYSMDDASITIGSTALFTHCIVRDQLERDVPWNS